MAKTKVTRFLVEGEGVFPFDMLRYDQAWPERTEDAIALDRQNWRNGDHGREHLAIRLVTHSHGITPDRWASFGWRVTAQQTSTF